MSNMVIQQQDIRREVGTGYFDKVSMVVTGGTSSTTALKGSTEAEQFQSK